MGWHTQLLASIVETDTSDKLQEICIGVCYNELKLFCFMNALMVTDEKAQIQATSVKYTKDFLKHSHILSSELQTH
jgi:hypothetical protein